MKAIYLLALLCFVSCGEAEPEGTSLRDYFYPLNQEDKYYVYRDTVSGLAESIHRVYSIEDSKGKHLVVETYKADGRITEAYNYNQENLLLDDHMVVDKDGKKRQAELLRNKLYPRTDEEKTYFASRFPGLTDSTWFVFEIQNVPEKTKYGTLTYNEKEYQSVDIYEGSRFAVVNPISKKENAREQKVVRRFAKGLGLVEYYNTEGKFHFVLEKILDAKEGARIMKEIIE